jgi:hypothetical protein
MSQFNRDPKDLQAFKKLHPMFSQIPDSEFQFVNGKWFISKKATTLLAFKAKNKDLIKFVNGIEKELN